MVLSGVISIASSLIQGLTNLPGVSSLRTSPTYSWTVTAGTGSDQADLKYAATLTLTAAPTALDLTALLDAQGNAINFARVKSVIVSNLSTTAGHSVAMGYSTTTTNAHTAIISNPGQVTIRPSTAISQSFTAFLAPDATGYPVSSSNKLVNFDPGANTIIIAVEIIGASV